MDLCYCRTCKRVIQSLGIARHRAAHRDKKEKCIITYSSGKTYEHDYSKRNIHIPNSVEGK